MSQKKDIAHDTAVHLTSACIGCPDPHACRYSGYKTKCKCGWSGLLPKPAEGHVLGYKDPRCPSCRRKLVVGTERGHRYRCRKGV